MNTTQRVKIKTAMILGLMSTGVVVAATPSTTETSLTKAAPPTKSQDAGSAKSARPQDKQAIKAIKSFLVDQLKMKVEDIQLSEIPNFYQVMTNKGILYISADRRHMFYGDLYHVQDGITNITKRKRGQFLSKKLVAFEKDMIVYHAPKEQYVVTVFTDTSCGYCKMLHEEIDDYLKAGITVRYLAFPRRGRDSANLEEMQSVWCAKEQKKALTAAKKGLPIAKVAINLNCDDIIKQYNLGVSFDVSGTPAIVLANGDIIPGYLPAKKLLAELQKQKK